MLPLLIAASGIVASVLGTFLVRSKEQASFSDLLWSLRRGDHRLRGNRSTAVPRGSNLARHSLAVERILGHRRGPDCGSDNRPRHRVLHLLRLSPHQGGGGDKPDGLRHGGNQRLGHGDDEHSHSRADRLWRGDGRLRALQLLRRCPCRRWDALDPWHHPRHRRLRSRGRQRGRHRRAGPFGAGGAPTHPTPSTRWATPLPPPARASPSAPRRLRRWR